MPLRPDHLLAVARYLEESFLLVLVWHGAAAARSERIRRCDFEDAYYSVSFGTHPRGTLHDHRAGCRLIQFHAMKHGREQICYCRGPFPA